MIELRTSDCAFPVIVELIFDKSQDQTGKPEIAKGFQYDKAYLDLPTADSPERKMSFYRCEWEGDWAPKRTNLN